MYVSVETQREGRVSQPVDGHSEEEASSLLSQAEPSNA